MIRSSIFRCLNSAISFLTRAISLRRTTFISYVSPLKTSSPSTSRNWRNMSPVRNGTCSSRVYLCQKTCATKYSAAVNSSPSSTSKNPTPRHSNTTEHAIWTGWSAVTMHSLHISAWCANTPKTRMQNYFTTRLSSKRATSAILKRCLNSEKIIWRCPITDSIERRFSSS